MAKILTAAGANIEKVIPVTGESAAFNLTSGAKLIKVGPGRVGTLTTIVAGTTVGTVNDAATTGAAAIGNQIAAVPNTLGASVPLNFPFANGLVIVPGTGQVLAVSYL
jgi:hypothetical protein